MFLGKHLTQEEEHQLDQWVKNHYLPLEPHIQSHMGEAVDEMINTFSLVDEDLK